MLFNWYHIFSLYSATLICMHALFLSIYAHDERTNNKKTVFFISFALDFVCLFMCTCVWLDFSTRTTTTKYWYDIHTHIHNGVPRNCELISILHLINILRFISRSSYCKLLNTFPSHTCWRNKIHAKRATTTINSPIRNNIPLLYWLADWRTVCMHLIDGTWMAYKFATEFFFIHRYRASSSFFLTCVSHLKNSSYSTVYIHNFIN